MTHEEVWLQAPSNMFMIFKDFIPNPTPTLIRMSSTIAEPS